MSQILDNINRFVWGIPALILILGVGLFLSLQTGFVQLTFFPLAIKEFLKKFRRREDSEGTTSPYRALCTALAATVGTGNLAGVAGAIAIGGPGAIFWMWICAFLGMVTKYAEATLAVHYRVKTKNGEFVGGPMYMITQGMGKKWFWLACVYSLCGVIASFGVGNATQINVMIAGIHTALSSLHISVPEYSNVLIGAVSSVVIGAVFLGGAKRIGGLAEQLVPFASIVYLLMGIGVLMMRSTEIPRAMSNIVRGAFCPQAVTGGVLGSCFTALRIGAARGVFTNEAGMGTASIAHAAADVKHAAQQGLMGIMEVFLDTIVICTMTALVILCSGIPIPFGEDTGILLTVQAFSSVYGDWISVPISLALCCFAFATVLGWGLYGARCAQYLFGENVWKPFVYIQMVTVVLGAVLNTQTVWSVSETMNGLMAIPNLITLAVLSPQVRRLTGEYKHISHHLCDV